jgi:hypothetical protein
LAARPQVDTNRNFGDRLALLAGQQQRMPEMSFTLKIAIPALVAGLVLAGGRAQAIQCDGDFQVVDGQEISTPYCRDNALAAVARERGFDVSDAAIRNNPERKQEVCRWIGSDIRTRPACDEVLPDDGGRR